MAWPALPSRSAGRASFNNILKLCGLELPAGPPIPGADGALRTSRPQSSSSSSQASSLSESKSARATCGIVLVKLTVIVFFIAVGSSSVDTANWSPFMPFGFAGVGAAAAIVFFAYIGFDAVSTTAEEAKNPQRDLPIGIFASLAVCTLLYITVAAVLTGLVPFSNRHPRTRSRRASRGRIQVGRRARGRWGSGGITSVLVVMMLGQIRVFFAMSRTDSLDPGSQAFIQNFERHIMRRI